ncbi:MAG TPA: FAD-binding domain-containing protein [Dongiaceae bacterium]|nr:FAD-binding domain-containing protein [Dongiaceae bacterium]
MRYRGAYARQWALELGMLPDRLIHKPRKAGSAQLAVSGIGLGETCPLPMEDHDRARKRARAAYWRAGSARASGIS